MTRVRAAVRRYRESRLRAVPAAWRLYSGDASRPRVIS